VCILIENITDFKCEILTTTNAGPGDCDFRKSTIKHEKRKQNVHTFSDHENDVINIF